MLIKLDHNITSLVKRVYLGLKNFVDNSGQLIVKLDKVLYGIVQNACVWYEHLINVIEKFALRKTKWILNKHIDGLQMTLVVNVENILILAIQKIYTDQIIIMLKQSSNMSSQKRVQMYPILEWGDNNSKI